MSNCVEVYRVKLKGNTPYIETARVHFQSEDDTLEKHLSYVQHFGWYSSVGLAITRFQEKLNRVYTEHAYNTVC